MGRLRLLLVLAGGVSALAAGALIAGPAQAASASGGRPLDTAPTTTTLTLFTNDVFFGTEDAVRATVDVSGGNGNPGGSFVLQAGSTVLCGGNLADGEGTCMLTPMQLAPGSYTLTASYSGDENSAPSSDTASLVVETSPTTTLLTLSPASVTIGHEDSVTMTARDTSPSGAQAGPISIAVDGHTLCTAFDGAVSCGLTASQLTAGTHQVTAHYAGQPGFASSDSPAQTLTVTRQPTNTGLTLSAPNATFGHEQSEKLTVQVKPRFTGPAPAGKVTIKAGSTRICTITLAKGKGSCRLTARKLRPGTYRLTARYAGRTPYAGSASARKTLTVTK